MTELRLHYKNGVFFPCNDDDYDKAHALKPDSVYKCKISNDRNYEFLKKYMKLLHVAWEGLNEKQTEFFKNNFNCFRHSIEMTAGSIEPVFDFKTMQMTYARVSVSFDTMSQDDFSNLFERVKDVLVNSVFRKCQDKEFLNLIMTF